MPELKGKGYGSFTVQEVADMDADVNMDEKNYHDPKSAFWDFGRSMGWFIRTLGGRRCRRCGGR